MGLHALKQPYGFYGHQSLYYIGWYRNNFSDVWQKILKVLLGHVPDPEVGKSKIGDEGGLSKESVPAPSKLKGKEKVSGKNGDDIDIFEGVEIKFGLEDWGGDVAASPTHLPSPTPQESQSRMSLLTPQASPAHQSGQKQKHTRNHP